MPPLPAGFSPSVEASSEVVTRFKKKQFGDGYIQIAPDGINPVRYEWDLEFLALTDARANELQSFFAGLATVTPSFVQWTAPDGISGDWHVEEIRRSYIHSNCSSIRVKFIYFQSA